DVLEHVVRGPVADGARQHRARLGTEADDDFLCLASVLSLSGRDDRDRDERERDDRYPTAHDGLLMAWQIGAARPQRPRGPSVSDSSHTRSFGSKVSRSQSPSRLTPSAVSASAAPGNAPSHHATYRKSRLSLNMLPHAGVGGWTPKPRNEMAASATTNCENCRLATTMMDGATLGRTCRKSSRMRPTPSAAAACT